MCDYHPPLSHGVQTSEGDHPRLGALRRIAAILAICAILLTTTVQPVWPQLSVFDASVFSQTVAEVAHLLSIIRLLVQDLAPFTEVGLALQLAADLAAMMQEVDLIAQQIQGRYGMWGSIGVPVGSQALGQYRWQTNELCRQVAIQGLQAQSLLSRVPILLDRLTRVLSSLERILGSVAGLQASTVMLAEVSGHLVLLQTMTAASQEPHLCRLWSEQMRRQSMETLQRSLAEDYGRMRE